MLAPFAGSYDMSMVDEACSENEHRLLAILEVFAEIEQGDPRLMIVLAASRIDAVFEAFTPKLARQHKSRPPRRFSRRVKLAWSKGRIDDDFRRYVDALRYLRNETVHRPTTSVTLTIGEPLKRIEIMHDCTRQVPVWSDQPTPAADFGRCVFASCVAGVMAAELEFTDEAGEVLPMSFEPLAVDDGGLTR